MHPSAVSISSAAALRSAICSAALLGLGPAFITYALSALGYAHGYFRSKDRILLAVGVGMVTLGLALRTLRTPASPPGRG